ncbi:MAG: hypothetical protein VW455_01200 [Nitrospinota bacterium]
MTKKIKICKGPGCKAWKSEKMANLLKKMPGSGEVCMVECMNKCGGGASIRLKNHGKIVKLREAKEVTRLLDADKASFAAVC